MSDRERRGDAPGDIILEPNEHVLVATRPLFLWEPLVLLLILLVVGALYATGQANGALAGSLIIAITFVLAQVAVFLKSILYEVRSFGRQKHTLSKDRHTSLRCNPELVAMRIVIVT